MRQTNDPSTVVLSKKISVDPFGNVLVEYSVENVVLSLKIKLMVSKSKLMELKASLTVFPVERSAEPMMSQLFTISTRSMGNVKLDEKS